MRIITDSSSDLHTGTPEFFESVPMLIYTDKEQFLDDGTIDIDYMLTTLENHKGRSYTSCPGVDSWVQAFAGEEEIYVVAITSGLSGTYNSALTARDMYLEEHPNAKVAVFDSLSTGPEMKMAVDKIIELKEAGATFEEICEKVQKYLDQVHLLFVLGSVHNLAQNGRVNKVIASAVGVLGINIIGFADEIGTIKQVGKGRGNKRIVSHLLDQMKKIGYKGGKVNVNHVLNEKLPQALEAAIRKEYPDVEFEYYQATGLCSYYAERNGIIVGFECE